MSNPSETTATGSSGPAAGKVSESAYLQQQAEAAKNAIAGAFADLKSDLGKGVDPRQWMKTHPWMTLASAAVAGFAAAAAAVPSKEGQALKKLQAIERAIHGHRAEGGNGHSAESEHKQEPQGMMAMIFREMIGAVKPALIAVLTAKMNPQNAPPPPQADSADGSNQSV